MNNFTKTRFESTSEFKPIWETMPIGTEAWMVNTFDGDSGECVGREYTLDCDEDLDDMKEVSDGYFFETYKLVKR